MPAAEHASDDNEKLPAPETCFWVATLGAPHGLGGSVWLWFETDRPERYLTYPRFLYRRAGETQFLRWVEVEELEPLGDGFRLKLKGCQSRTTAEKLRNAQLHLPLAELPQLSGSDFYYHEVIGFTAQDETSGATGIVEDVWEHPVHDLLVLNIDGQQQLAPIRDEWLIAVDRNKQKLLLKLPPGMLSLQEQEITD